MLKTSCVLLKVLMLTKAAIASSLEDLKDLEASNISVFEINDYNTLSNIEIVQDHSDSVAVRNEVESIPSVPTFPRAFVEFDKSVNEKNNISVTFRWKQPEFTNRVIQKYSVEYWFVENLNRTIQSIDIISTTILQHKVYDVKPDTMYYFKVRAYNEVGPGPYTKIINVSTTHENPVPLLLVNSSSGMHVLDMDLQIDFLLNEYRAMEFAYSALERKIYWINDQWQLMTMDLNTSSIKTKQNYTKIADLDAPAHNLCIDWVARNLYWIQISNQTSNIMKLDITLWQFGIVKYENILKINEFTHLNVLPSIGYLYWMGLNSDNENVIMQSDFDVRRMKPFLKSKSNFCSCRHKLEPSSLQIDSTNIDKPLMYWTSEDRLIVADIYGCRCNLILSAGNNQILFNYLTIDKTNIYLHSNSERLIYILEKKYALLESKGNAFKRVQKVNMLYTFDTHRVIAFGKSLQPYPPTICLIPHMKDYHVEIATITANSIVVRLPEAVFNDGCRKYNLATTIYTISVSYCLNNDRNECEEFNVQTYERHYEIPNLMPFTEYTLKLALSNFYVDKLSMGLLFGSGVTLTTTPGAPGMPTVTKLRKFMYQLNWEPAHDSQVIIYQLEGLAVENNYKESNQTEENKHWKLYYNGTDNYWIITRDIDQKYRFRVRAENAYGFGAWSELSAIIDLTQLSAVIDLTQSIEILVQYLPLILSFVVTVVIYVCYFYCYRQHMESNEQVLPSIMNNIELATLYNIPVENVQLNPQYARRLQYKQKNLLTTIKRKQITLTKDLGIREFGEVFKGTVQNLEGSSTTPVAIKMLRKKCFLAREKEILARGKTDEIFSPQTCAKIVGHLLGCGFTVAHIRINGSW